MKKKKKRNKAKKLLLNEKKLGKVVKHALFDQPGRNTGMSITLYTGFWGMIQFDLCMMGFDSPWNLDVKDIHIAKRSHLLIISVERKEGPIKVIFDRNRNSKGLPAIRVTYGTVTMKECQSFQEASEWIGDWRESVKYTI